jgi:hypothetical protein
VVNIAGAIITAIYYNAFVGSYVFGLCVLTVCLKYVEVRLALYILAQFEQERPFRGWQGLFTTHNYYDAACVPLSRF